MVPGVDMSDKKLWPREDVTIGVERMMRFCLLAQMLYKCHGGKTTVLPLHLTRFGTLLLETTSFLYSLFEERSDSINLVRLWQEFDHPFVKDLHEHATRLDPFKEEMKFLRSRLGFHGSLTRSHEKGGLGAFDIDSGRAQALACLTKDMQRLFLLMIGWYIKKIESDTYPSEMMWKEFAAEMNEIVG